MEKIQCRACFAYHPESINLFTKVHIDGTETDYATVMMSCSEVMISLDDEHPKGICPGCLQNMTQAFVFKKMCENSHREFEKTSTTQNVQRNTISPDTSSKHAIATLFGSVFTKIFSNAIKLQRLTEKKSQHTNCDEIVDCGENQPEEIILYSEHNSNDVSKQKGSGNNFDENIPEETVPYNDHNSNDGCNQKRGENNCDENIPEETVPYNEHNPNDGCNQKRGENNCDENIPEETVHYDEHNSNDGCNQKTSVNNGDENKPEETVPLNEQKSNNSLKRKKPVNMPRILCELCKKTFRSHSLHTAHLAKHALVDNGSSKFFKCHECGKEYKTSSGLKYHISSHKGIKEHKCSYKDCKWSFISKQSLVNHLMKHSDKKMMLCSICGKRYFTKDSLSHHLKSHSNLRSHKCDYCDKAFLQSCHLKMHMATHKGLRPFICEVCGRSYALNSHFKTHFEKYCGRGVEPVFKFKKNEKINAAANNNNDC